MKKRVVFVDVRNKLISESTLFECFVKSDVIVPLTPYSSYLLDKKNIEHVLFSDLITNEEFTSNVLSDYYRVEDNILKFSLHQYQFILRDISKYITFEHYLRSVQNKIKQYDNSVYISNVDNKKGLGKDTPLSCFLDFSSEIGLDSDEKFYNKNRAKVFFSKIKTNNVFNLFKRNILKGGIYSYDNEINAKDYKKIKIDFNNRSEKLIICNDLLKLLEGLTFNFRVWEMLRDELANLLPQEKMELTYLPFTFLNGSSMYTRLLTYKSNNIPTIFMQHGSYVNVDYFLKYNEVLPSDVNLVFNEYTKELFESMGANSIYCVGTQLYNKKVKKKNKEFDFVYITYCTKYSYPGFFVASEVDMLSPVADNIFNRHKEVIDFFGNQFPEKKICIKVQSGMFTGQQLYIPLDEYSEKYPNIKIIFDEPLHSLIEKSEHIISDYFSSEFSNRNIINDKKVIMFTDIIKLPNDKVKDELEHILFLVDDFTKFIDLICNFESKVIDKKSIISQGIIDKYTSSNLDTESLVRDVINSELKVNK